MYFKAFLKEDEITKLKQKARCNCRCIKKLEELGIKYEDS